MKLFNKKKYIDAFALLDKKTLTGIKLCSCIIFIGIFGMIILSMMKKTPVEVERGEPELQVEVMKVKKSDYPVYLSAYGEAGSIRVVPIAPEVSGKVIKVHPRLEAGEIIKKGELLFKIDPRNYELIINSGRERLRILERSRELAGKEFERVKKLFEKNKVGTVSGVEAAEKVWLSTADTISQTIQVVETAKINLNRCEVRAQFTGRINNVELESGQFVSTGKRVLTLVDDLVLEIHLPVDSAEAGKWLEYNNVKKSEWFAGIKQVPCEIRWTESQNGKFWNGILHRIVEYDRKTRTVILAVRTVCSRGAAGADLLVDGMFCSVKIPGKTMNSVVRLPRSAISMENTVFTTVDNRLVTVDVDIIRSEGDYVYVDGGINNDDLVITTRLVNPLEKTLIHIVNQIKG